MQLYWLETPVQWLEYSSVVVQWVDEGGLSAQKTGSQRNFKNSVKNQGEYIRKYSPTFSPDVPLSVLPEYCATSEQ